MNETTRLWYMRPSSLYETERPYHIFEPLPPGYKTSNVAFERGPPQTIVDVRGHEDVYTLEEHGFTFRPRALPTLNWDDEMDINAKYIADIKQALTEMPSLHGGVELCEVFDWRLRKSGSQDVLQHPSGDRMVKISPAYIVHIDQSPAGVLDRVRRQLGPGADALIHNRRVQVYNVWRPLVDVVEDSPLALCDARTVSRTDLVEVEFINSDYVRRSYMVKYNDNFQFRYLSKMTKNEICIFKVFDSADVECKWVPHAAFEHTRLPSLYIPRESIEVRLLVLLPANK